MICDNLQVLITTMNLSSGDKLLHDMNIRSDFLIGNQCQVNKNEEMLFGTHKGEIISRNARGVGKNRNELLSRATADICVLADDDMTFTDLYETTVLNVFSEHKTADVVIFNLDSEDDFYARKASGKSARVSTFNYMSYGAARIAFRLQPILYHGITFNTMFGGGTPHKCGEDSLFLRDCMRAGLKIITVPISIAHLRNAHESTWFDGYNDKYFFDKGVFLAFAHPRLCRFFAIYLVLKHPEYLSVTRNRKNILKTIMRGIKFVKTKEYKGGKH